MIFAIFTYFVGVVTGVVGHNYTDHHNAQTLDTSQQQVEAFQNTNGHIPYK